MKACPRCDAEIGSTAIACSCGWNDRRGKTSSMQALEPDVPCAYDGCIAHAKVRIKTRTGLAAMCMAHYDKYYLDIAKKKCELLSLNTVPQKREWVRKEMKALYHKLALGKPLREPGEDEDYTYIQA